MQHKPAEAKVGGVYDIALPDSALCCWKWYLKLRYTYFSKFQKNICNTGPYLPVHPLVHAVQSVPENTNNDLLLMI